MVCSDGLKSSGCRFDSGFPHSDNWDKDIYSDGYKNGANYVLGEIEKLVKFNRWAAQDLYELIEQLKK